MPASRDPRTPRRLSEYADDSSSHPRDVDDELGETSEDMDDGTRSDLNDESDSSSLRRGTSPSPSITPSVYSYHSSVDGSVLLKNVHGRVLNNTVEVISKLLLLTLSFAHGVT